MLFLLFFMASMLKENKSTHFSNLVECTIQPNKTPPDLHQQPSYK